jgi:hypothetical protein
MLLTYSNSIRATVQWNVFVLQNRIFIDFIIFIYIIVLIYIYYIIFKYIFYLRCLILYRRSKF